MTPLMTKAELATAMRVSVRTVERWMQQGLPTRSIGENTRFNRAEAASWLRARFGIDVRELLDAVEAPTEPDGQA
jgi:phage terminase Nu1 subunit (DNA packaging protein)